MIDHGKISAAQDYYKMVILKQSYAIYGIGLHFTGGFRG
jgi:hypothetical protein